MSRLTYALDHAAFVSTAPRRLGSAPYWRGILTASVALAIVAAFLAGHDAASARAVASAEPELTRLLRFMAVVKAILGAGAILLVWWRLAYPATLRTMLAYITAGALMAAAPGLIWSMAHVVSGAVLFHAGLALLLLVCWGDTASTPDLFRGSSRRRA